MTRNDNAETDESESTNDGLPVGRRSLLAAGAMGLGLAGAGQASADSIRDHDEHENSPFAVKDHDHSGEYGATTRLGEHAPVESIVAERVHSREVPHADVTAYGAEGDGETDDTAAIQAAIDSVDAGGEVFLPPGTYNVSDRLILGTEGMTFRGSATLNVTKDLDWLSLLRVAAEDVTIEDITIEGNDLLRNGIRFRPGPGGRAERVKIYDLFWDSSIAGIWIDVSPDVVVRDCEIDGVTSDSNRMTRGVMSDVESPRVTVEGCTVKNISAGDDADGIRVSGADSKVLNNHIENCDKRAIKVDTYSHRSRVEGNVCLWGTSGPSRAGIQLQAEECKALGNHVEADGFTSGAGILDITDNGGTIEGNTVVMQDADSGEWPLIDDAIEVSGDITVAGNTIRVGGGRAGIRVQESAEGVTLADNNISGPGDAGISLRKAGVHSPTTVSITGGTIRGVDDGVTIHDGTDVVITGVAFDTASTDINDPNSAATVGTNVSHQEDDDDEETFSVPNQSLDFDGSVDELDGLESVSVEDDFVLFRGDREIGGDVWITHDESALYLAAAIDDAQHSQDSDPDSLYRGDSIQFGVAEGDPNADDTYPEMTIGLTDAGPQVYRIVLSDGSIVEEGVFDAATAEITRDDGAERTVYEIGLPWDGLDIDPSGGTLGVGAAIADYDGDDETALYEWGGGIFGGKDPSEFHSAELEE